VADLSIRAATQEDTVALVELQLQLGKHHAGLDPENPRYQVDRIRWGDLIGNALSDRASRFLVAARGNDICGFVKITLVDKPWGTSAEMDTLVVDENVRGSGVGKRLVKAAEELARAVGARGVRANVLSGNTRGQDFYRRMGYDEIAVRFGKPLT
jgi:ribosomal protein S18 acetylase RimI-like enzyme